MLNDYFNGQAGIILRVKLRNSSVSTGAGLTGLTNASTGLILSTICDNEATATAYTVAGSTIDTVTTLGTYAAPTATHCRFREVDATNHKGLYEIQVADARFAVAGAKEITISLSGATNLAEADFKIPLRAVNPYLASYGLSLAKTTNLTGLNDIAATAIVSSGAITTSGGAVSTVTTVGTLTTYTGNTLQTGDSYPIVNNTTFGNAKLVRATTPANTLDVSATGEAGVDWANVGSPTTAVGLSGTTVGTVTSTTTAVNLTNLPAVPTDWLAAAGVKADAVAKIQAGLATPTNITGGTMTTVANLTNAPTVGDFTATMKASLNASTPTVTASLGTNAPDGWIRTATFAAGAAIPRVTLADTVTAYTGNTPQTGDSFARIGTTGSGLTSVAQAATALSTANWTTARAGYLDNLSAGAVALHSDVTGLATTTALGGLITTVGAAGAGLTALGDARLANLDAAITSRLATGGYTAPDNTSIAAIKAKTDNLPSDPADESLVIAATAAIQASIAGLSFPSTATIAVAVRDVNNASPAANSLGAGVNAAAISGDPWGTTLPGSYGSGTAGAIVGTNLNATVSSRSTFAGGAVAGVTAPVTVGTVNDKAGYSLAPTGLDAIATTPAALGVTPNFRQMIVATWRRWFRLHVASGSTLTGYADDGTTVLTTQPVAPPAAVDQTQGSA